MVRNIVVDFPEKPLKKSLTQKQIDKYKRDKAKERKLDYLIRRFDNLPIDTLEGWVNEDFDKLEDEDDESEQFCNDLSSLINLDVESTGTRKYHYHKPLGRFIESIRRSCSENDKTTILIIRGNDPTVYRLGVERGKETTLLSTAIKQGFILTKVKIYMEDRYD
jgi:hypothetical protein